MKIRTLLLSLLALAMTVEITAQSRLTKENVRSYYAIFKEIFTDGTCSELKSPYSAMSDEQLMNYYGDMPQEFMEIALKAKNNTWAAREKEFRVAEYEPYGNTYSWSVLLNTNPYSYLQRPTGITATTGDTLLIFVGDELPSGMMLKLLEVQNNQPFTDAYVYEAEKFLTRGVNMVTVAQEDAMLFIGYAVNTDTTATSKRLSDYPDVTVHIEGGKVNGYFDARRHTDEDWRDMLANHFKHYSVQVRGERVIFQMAKEDIEKVCPNTITDAIGWWDECVAWQHELMGADKYHDRWNALMMARSGHDNSYMYATHYYTYYEHSTLKDILPRATVYANPGQMWGPAHEIGHMNQGAINIVSCTEASNNLFSNVQVHRAGKTTTRGSGVKSCKEDFENKVAFPLRGDVIGKSRMFFQLYLYFHAAGKDTTFYPRLFDALRQDRLRKINGGDTYAKDDQLKFAEKCCEIAQMDFSEFFDAWGFFEPMNRAEVGDYGTYFVTLTKEDAEASRTRMQQYEKKGGHLMFIEDRIKPSKRTDGVDGNRLDFSSEYAIGEMGSTGQWGDYMDESVKAEGYYYKRGANYVTIVKEENAKGALGFKLYDADSGELLAFNNEYSLKIPVSASDSKFRVVAAQADGTDAELQDIAESDSEEMQIEALNAVLATASTIMGKQTTDGRNIGYYYTDALTGLTELYNNAKEAADNKDTSIHTYKEWAALLNAEIERLSTDPNARAYLKELDVYRILNAKEKAYQLCYDKYGLKANKQNQTAITSDDKKWMFESTGELHHYYIKNKNGLYLNAYEIGVGTSCSGTDSSTAVVFKANYRNDGKIYFSTKNEGAYLTLNSEYNVVCTTDIVDNSMWTIVRVEANNTGVDELKAENEKAKTVYDLTGRRVQEITKPGIYIVNGKKVIVK